VLLVDEQDTGEVRSVLEQVADRYAAMDAEGVAAAFVGEETVAVGTGVDEVRFGLTEVREQVERDMSQADELAFGMENLRVSVFGDAAFAYADMTITGSAGGESFDLPTRWTTGLIRTDDGWRIAQFHASVPFGDQAEGGSFPS
jgi:ketosteroid isomerase-like protein